jgi:ATP-dependent Clp protease ATP-binding subunit ClpA
MLGVMFERFTDGARQVIVLAQDEARTLGHNYIGVEHLLLGLLREESGAASPILRSFDVTPELARNEILRIVPTAAPITQGQKPFTPSAKRVLERALREGLSLGTNHIDTEHLLLAVLSETDEPSAAVLGALGADTEAMREMVLAAARDPSTKARLGRSAAERALKHIDARLAAAQAPEQVLRATLAAKTDDAAGDAVAELLNIERWLAEFVIRQPLITFTAEHVTVMQEHRRHLIERLDPNNRQGAD